MIMTSDSTANVVHDSMYFDDIKLHYVTAGTGDPLVLLHGWPQTWYAWRKLIPLLSDEFTVIAPDLRGCGDTSKPADGYDKKTVARDIRRLVEILGDAPVHIVGHDIGAAVGYAYAAQWPEHTRTMTFIESSLPAFGQEELMDVAKGGSWHFGFNMAGDITEDLVRGRERLLIEYWMRRTTVGVVDPTSAEPHALDQYARAMAQPGGLRGSFAHYRALPQDRADNRELGRTKLTMPVLAVEGRRGQGGHSISTMRKVAADVKTAVIDRAGHYPAEENPAELANVLLDFLLDG
ncbi:alpha/beta fold hydrolase [Mycolicibacterium goodii]|uniref:alpha/beta fold hydrolase n=1 Tax=Mycolicibacterium goodii TaxID=134601 RepID=UPI002580D5F9|nr:alpha/beta hydrolase [Mycolicibacterium goodii]